MQPFRSRFAVLIAVVATSAATGLLLTALSGRTFVAWLIGCAATVVSFTCTAPALRRLPDICAASVLASTAVVWLSVLLPWQTPLVARQLASSAVLLIAVTAVCGTAVRLLVAFKVALPLATALVLVGIVAWLTWPAWATAAPAWVVRVHPLLALNGLVADNGIWSEHPLAYRIGVFGQDVGYVLPTSVWPATIAHGGLAVLLMFAIGGLRRLTGGLRPGL